MKRYLAEMFAGSLAITLVTELAMAFFWIRGSGKRAVEKMREKDLGRRLLLVALVNLLTNPPAVLLCWLGRMYLPRLPEAAQQMAVELMVVGTEAFVYCSFWEKERWRIEKPAVFAIGANVCSWLLGVFCIWIRRSL